MTPEGWTETRFGNAFAKRAERGKAGLPTMSVTINDGLVFRDSIDRKMDTNLLAEEHLLVRKGDIAYNMMRMWQGASGLAEADALVSPAYVVLRPTAAIDPLFAAYLFKHPRTIYLFWAYSHGLTEDRLRLYFDDFSLIPICLPPIPEQRKIAEILSTWDRAIEKVEELIVSGREQKQALMHALLTGKNRLSGFSGTWKRRVFNDVAHVDQSSLGQDTPPDFSFRYISLSDVQVGVISQQLPLTSFKEAPSRARRRLKAGDLLMATVRPNLKAFAIVKEEHSDCIASTGFAVLSVKTGFDSGYLFQYLFSDHVTTQIEGLVVGSNYPAINSSDVKALAILCPDLPEQQAIAELLNDADNEINALESQLSSLREEKCALMQQLLTGKRRVQISGDFA